MQLTDNDAMKIALKVADAVHYMHNHDPIVIHQDLKPQNILVITLRNTVLLWSHSLANSNYSSLLSYRSPIFDI